MIRNAPFLAIALLVVAACTPDQGSVDPDSPAYGKALYDQICAECHGSEGRGDGRDAAKLPVPPANLRGLAGRNGGVFDKDRVMSAIVPLPSDAQTVMPAFSHTQLGPIIIVEEGGIGTPVPADLLAIANYLETIQD